MNTTGQQQVHAVLARLTRIGSARRGQLSEQYFTRKNAAGRTVRHGPYFVWQRYVNGRKHSVRVPRAHVARVRADLERGQEVHALVDDLFLALEQAASRHDQDNKKKPSSQPPGPAKWRPH